MNKENDFRKMFDLIFAFPLKLHVCIYIIVAILMPYLIAIVRLKEHILLS